jgi:predicted ATPase
LRLEEAALRGRAHSVAPAARAQQGGLFAQFTAVLDVLARQYPLLLVLDDLHWADGGTAALLFHLGRRLAGSRILLVGAYRPSSLGARRLSGECHPLEPVVHEFGRDWSDIGVNLDQADGRQFIEAFLDAEPNRLGSAFRQALYQHTNGNPLFTIELVHSFQRSGALVRDKAGRWTEGSALDWGRWPPQVEAVIAGQVAELAQSDWDLLAAASVQGQTFIAEVVARVVQAEEDAVIRRLSGPLTKQYHLVKATRLERLDAPISESTPDPEGQQGPATGAAQRLSRYRFRHILVQDYLYRCLDEVEQGCLHEATGRALEALFAPAPAALDALAAQLARHFEAARLPTQAAAYHLRAGERAARLAAYEEAILHLRRGLAQLEPLPESPERARLEMALHQALAASPGLVQGPKHQPILEA